MVYDDVLYITRYNYIQFPNQIRKSHKTCNPTHLYKIKTHTIIYVVGSYKILCIIHIY